MEITATNSDPNHDLLASFFCEAGELGPLFGVFGGPLFQLLFFPNKENQSYKSYSLKKLSSYLFKYNFYK